jgi:hypothetical protein
MPGLTGSAKTRGALASDEEDLSHDTRGRHRQGRGRQHGEVGGLPEQEWSLRVTLVFRRDELGWRQVHRHADGLVHGIDLDQLSALARGRRTPSQ